MDGIDKRDYLEEIAKQRKKLDELEESIKSHTNLKLFRIYERDSKIQIPCAKCLKAGQVIDLCNKCGGRGVHNKTKSSWEVAKEMVEITKVDLDVDTRHTRYWTSRDEFFPGESNLVHYLKSQAQEECDKRNKGGNSK